MFPVGAPFKKRISQQLTMLFRSSKPLSLCAVTVMPGIITSIMLSAIQANSCKPCFFKKAKKNKKKNYLKKQKNKKKTPEKEKQ